MYLDSLRGTWSDDAVVRVHVDGLTQRSRYSEIHSTEDSCDSLRDSGSSSS